MLLRPARPSVMGCEESQGTRVQYSVIQPSLGVANTMPFLSQSVVSPPRLTPEPTRLGVRATRDHLLPPSVLR